MAKLGRPTLFSERIAHTIMKLSEEGKNLEEIAEIININPRTLYYWRHVHKDFFQSIDEAREIADSLVEASLFQTAVGYVTHEEKFYINPLTGELQSKKLKKQLPPNVNAIMFWLENRKPEKWGKRRQEDPNRIPDQDKPEIFEHREYMETRLLEMKKSGK